MGEVCSFSDVVNVNKASKRLKFRLTRAFKQQRDCPWSICSRPYFTKSRLFFMCKSIFIHLNTLIKIFKSSLALSTTYQRYRHQAFSQQPISTLLTEMIPPGCSRGIGRSESAGNVVSWARFWPRSPHEVTILMMVVTQGTVLRQKGCVWVGGRRALGGTGTLRDLEWNILCLYQYLLTLGLKRWFSVSVTSAY